MKFIKISFVLTFIALWSFFANAQKIGNINDAIFFNAKYKKDKVWDVQRSPAYPVAGQNWTLSGLQGSLDSRGSAVDWGQDRYIMLVAEPDNSNSANSLINDVTSSGGKYNIALKLYESNGTLVRVLSSWGKIAGIGEKGFMYECEGMFGTFFSVAAVPQSTVIEYRPTLGVITRLSEIINPSDLTRSLEKENLVKESSFFSNKYIKENVWDVQRSPAYPIAGQIWTLSGLKGSLDANSASVDWGNGRYVMLIAEADNTNNPNSLIDDINNTGTKLNISLKLYESNGSLVKVVSKWGKIYGIGAEGFMYEVEGKYGTFFSVARVSSSDVIRYKPNLSAITKLSELTKGLGSVKIAVIDQGGNKINGANFFTTKYTKEKVWDAQREPAFPVAGQDWTLKGLKPALDASGIRIDWGTGRYLMFVAETDNARWANSVVDDVNKSGAKYNISLKLYESNGTFVKEISKWGRVIGIGNKGFMYETEGKYGTFFSVGGANAATVIRYKPNIATVVRLSELLKGQASTNVVIEPVTIQIPTGYYTLEAKCSGAVLDVLDASTEDGATIQQWNLNGNRAQHWNIEPVNGAPGYYTLTARCSGKVLDVLNASKLDGATIQQWSLNGNTAQHWKIEPVPGLPGYYTLISRSSGKALDVPGASPDAGARIQQWTVNGSPAQQWKLEMVN